MKSVGNALGIFQYTYHIKLEWFNRLDQFEEIRRNGKRLPGCTNRICGPGDIPSGSLNPNPTIVGMRERERITAKLPADMRPSNFLANTDFI